MERLDKHGSTHHELFDENTAAIGNLGDIVEKHARDAVFFSAAERTIGGTDSGESDFEAEMLDADPADSADINPHDLFTDNEQVWATDQTGTVEGIARGFGTHLPQDLGRGGFHVEQFPSSVLNSPRRVLRAGEELDDYDDNDNSNGVDDPGETLARLSEPGVNDTRLDNVEPMPDRIYVHTPRPHNADDRLDATRDIQ